MATRQASYPVIVGAVATSTNPTSGQVMADTLNLGIIRPGTGAADYVGGGGIYEVLVTVSASAAAIFSVQRRNAANSANVGAVPTFRVAAGSTVAVPFRFEAEDGERFRVVMGAALTGDAEASIQAQKVG